MYLNKNICYKCTNTKNLGFQITKIANRPIKKKRYTANFLKLPD